MRKICICVLVLAVTAALIGCTAVDQATSKNRDAVKALNEGDVAQYKALVREAYALNPNDPFVVNNLGSVAEMEKNIPEAKLRYKECAEKAGDVKIAIGSPGMEGKLLKDVCADKIKRLEAMK